MENQFKFQVHAEHSSQITNIPRTGEPNEVESCLLRPAPEGLSLPHCQVNGKRDPSLRMWAHDILSIPLHPPVSTHHSSTKINFKSKEIGIAQPMSFFFRLFSES